MSFPFVSSKKLKNLKNKKIYIGDIATSYEIINKRAKKKNFSIEFDKAWIHGLLHLIGYDHVRNKDYDKMNRLDESKINPGFNYTKIPSLSAEGKEKLQKIKPISIGQASRISGVSPSDVSILIVYMNK